MDYRLPYVGNFIFSSYSYSSILKYSEGEIIPVTTYGDTIKFEGSIEFDTEQDSAIIITYRPEESGGWRCSGIQVYGSQLRPLLQRNGELDYPFIFETCGHHSKFSGSFSNPDSLNCHVGGGGLGGTWGHIIEGTRID